MEALEQCAEQRLDVRGEDGTVDLGGQLSDALAGSLAHRMVVGRSALHVVGHHAVDVPVGCVTRLS